MRYEMNKMLSKKTIAVLFVALMFGVSLGTMIMYFPVSSPNNDKVTATPISPAISFTNSAYINSTLNGYINKGTSSSGTTTITAFEAAESTFNFDTTPTWSQSGDTWTSTNFVSGSIQYWGDTQLLLYDIVFNVPIYSEYDALTAETDWRVSLTTATVYFTLDGNTQSYTWSPDYSNSGSTTGSLPTYYATMDPSFSFPITSGYYSPSVYVSVSTSSSIYEESGPVESTTSYGITNAIETTSFTQDSIDGYYGWTYSGVTCGNSWSNPANTQALQLTYSSPYALEWTGGGQTSSQSTGNTLTFGSSPPSSGTFQDVSGDPNVPSFSVSWSTPNVVVPASGNTNSGSISQTISTASGTTNEFTSSISTTITPPSSWINGASVDGKNWETTGTVYAQHLGQEYYSYTQASWYYTFNGGSYTQQTNANYHNVQLNSQTINSGTAYTVSTEEFANTAPTLASQNVIWAGTSDTAILYLNVTQPDFSGEPIGETINWGDGSTTTVSPTATYNIVERHTYSSTGTYEISVVYSNSPDPDTNGLSSLSATSPSLPYVISISPTATPTPYSTLEKGQGISI